MPITQVSVFLDNRPGSLFEVMSQLDKNKIQIFALCIAEAGEFGMVRLIADDPQKAAKVLEDADFNLAKSHKNTEVTAIFITEENTLSKITKLLRDQSLNIDYAYSSAVHLNGKTAFILGASEVKKSEKMLGANGVDVLSLDDIKKDFT